MPNEIIQIYQGDLNPAAITLSDGFTNISFFYLTTNVDFEFDIDISLQIYLTPNVQRQVLLEQDDTFSTINIIKLPNELKQSPYNMRVAFFASEAIYIECYAVRTECCGESQLNQIKSQLNRLEMQMTLLNIQMAANNVLTGFLDFLVGTALTVVIPALAPGAIFSLLAPSVGNAFRIFFDTVPQFDLLPGQFYVSDGSFFGQVAAQSLGTVDSTLQYRIL